jgi:flavodoxin
VLKRGFFRAVSLTAAFLVLMGASLQMNFAAEEEVMSLPGTKKILVVYFSHSGNTREIANQIHKIVGDDIFEIQSVKTYPDDYDAVVKQARQELDSGYKAALKEKVDNFESYDLIFIGYPIWWGTFPAPVKTFLSEYDFSGKTLVPFCTHEGSGLGNSVYDIQKLCPKSKLLNGLAIRGGAVKTAQDKVSEWLREIKISK